MDYETIKRYYSEWWENRKDPRQCIFQKLNELVRNRIPDGFGLSALDIGSGKGTIMSFLVEKGYRVTGVDINEQFVERLWVRFPDATVICGDFMDVRFDERYDLVTAIQIAPIFEDLKPFIQKIAGLTRGRLLINISNRNSLHGLWVRLRGFRNSFVYMHTPDELEKVLEECGFRVVYRAGIGFITPLTLFSGFRGRIVPVWLAKVLNSVFDRLFPKFCHLYYVEAIKDG